MSIIRKEDIFSNKYFEELKKSINFEEIISYLNYIIDIIVESVQKLILLERVLLGHNMDTYTMDELKKYVALNC
ncbi:PIR Superfamily Protein [Plasmodium ovale curtisi]|uniref:PIR Superfamily Protein n=1 Tax=Plasmodium ovale curtisi TaxID=864141 RepID=A0A1A8X673_PLAOA|nr:PIR Superfamily Protein [Plasmodium ovale curtisi]